MPLPPAPQVITENRSLKEASKRDPESLTQTMMSEKEKMNIDNYYVVELTEDVYMLLEFLRIKTLTYNKIRTLNNEMSIDEIITPTRNVEKRENKGCLMNILRKLSCILPFPLKNENDQIERIVVYVTFL